MAQTSGVKPLTHINEQTGRPYERRHEVERKIEEALSLDQVDLLERIEIHERSDPRFLEEECLVYLLREYSREETRRGIVNAIFEQLRSRTEKFLRFELRKLNIDDIEDAWQDVMDVIHTKITGSDDLGDFAQVNFRSFLAAKVSDVRRKHLRRQNSDSRNVTPSWVHGSEPAGELEGEEKYLEPTNDTYLGEDVMNHELLSALSPDDRKLVELRLLGLPIEHTDPSVPTISRYFGVTPRTINNRLHALQRFASEWLEKEKGS
jgi:hypothetical protein